MILFRSNEASELDFPEMSLTEIFNGSNPAAIPANNVPAETAPQIVWITPVSTGQVLPVESVGPLAKTPGTILKSTSSTLSPDNFT